MRSKLVLTFAALLLLATVSSQAATLRTLVVETPDIDAYLEGVKRGKQLLKSKGSPATIRVWKARFAGDRAGTVVVAVEYPSLEALAKDDSLMKSDAELKAWLEGLNKIRKVVSDSIYDELTP